MATPFSTLRTVTLADLLKRQFPPREDLLEGLLRQGESLLLWAATGVGKTMVSLSMALAIAGGGSFLGWQNRAPRKVLYVDGEMNLEDLQGRLVALMAGMSGLNAESAGENVTLLSRQDQDPNKPFLDIASDEGQSALFERIRRERFDLVILDNFSVLADVADENDAAAMHPVLNFLMKLKTAKVATILVHHSNKGGDSYRGSSKITTTFEVVMGLKRHIGVKSTSPAAMNIQFDKFRGIAGETIQPKTAWLETDSGASVWKWELNEDAKLTEMVKAVQSCRFKTQRELAAHLGVSTGTASGWKQRAIGTQLITEAQWNDCFEAARGTLAASEEDENDLSDF